MSQSPCVGSTFTCVDCLDRGWVRDDGEGVGLVVCPACARRVEVLDPEPDAHVLCWRCQDAGCSECMKYCPCCHDVFPAAEVLCPQCRDGLELVAWPPCPTCGDPSWCGPCPTCPPL